MNNHLIDKILQHSDEELEKKMLINLLHSRAEFLSFNDKIDDENLGLELALIYELLLFYEPLDKTTLPGFETVKQRLIKEGLWNER